jgi:hypothetical protein
MRPALCELSRALVSFAERRMKCGAYMGRVLNPTIPATVALISDGILAALVGAWNVNAGAPPSAGT